MPLNGFDIANVNGAGIINRALGGDFVILKASEGTGFKDGYHDQWAARVRAAGKCVGHYHYAHLANSPVAEADWFLMCASPQSGDVLVLDFEPYGQGASPASYPGWALAFTDRVRLVTGVSCWIYLNDDMGSQMVSHASPDQLTALHALPLWKARYASSPGSLLGWPALTAWQSAGTGIDVDQFYGDVNTWRALAVGHPQDVTPQDTIYPVQPSGDDMLGYILRCKTTGECVFICATGVKAIPDVAHLANLLAMGFGYGPTQAKADTAEATVWQYADPGPFQSTIESFGGLK